MLIPASDKDLDPLVLRSPSSFPRPWRRHVGALYCGDMATETSTIRVTRATRDLLAEQARQRGVSVAALLGEIAEERRRDAIWRSEYEANRLDEQHPDAQAELREWEATLEDGVD